ncbi:MAG: hypothetical protein C5B54_01865 [Acidobacteria bacterium]|nr:MAG: hypothetical protein C5B54_01865 [Acidobacteriota bacterium]
MGLIESILGYAKNLITIENKVSALHEEIRTMASTMEIMTDKIAMISERLARVEGKFEAYENIAVRTQGATKQIKEIQPPHESSGTPHRKKE